MPSWKAIVIVAVTSIATLYVASRAAGFVLSSGALTITHIDVKGTRWMAPEEALALLDGLRGSSMVTVKLESWRQKLLEAPWVDDVAMRRVFPGTVTVAITERQPLGIGRIKDALYLLDRDGVADCPHHALGVQQPEHEMLIIPRRTHQHAERSV